MADAPIAMIDEYLGFGSNPASLGFAKRFLFDYSTQRVQKGITFEHIGLAYRPTLVEALAVGFDVLHFGGTDFYTDGDVRSLGYEARMGISYGRHFAESFSAGVSVQALTSTTGPNSVWAISGDVGVIYMPSKYIRYAFMINGISSDYDVVAPLLTTDVQTPRIARILAVGITFDYPFNDQKQRLVISMQNEKIIGEESLIYKIGIEYQPYNLGVFRLPVRCGFLVRGTDIEPRLGLGVGYSQLSLDYVYRYTRRNSQPSHMFTFAFALQ